MNKQELLQQLNKMYEEAKDKWYDLHMKHSGEWHEIHPDTSMYSRMNTLKEIIELVNNLE